jgi:DNA replication and repair protein RecF
MVVLVALTDFRNYATASLEMHAGVTVLHGDNGQGKTNILEAVYLLSRGGSHRPGTPQAMVREGAASAFVRARAEHDGHPVEVGAEVPRQGRIRMSVNGKVARRRSQALGHVRAVLFSPEDLDLVKGSPGGRRTFLDGAAALVRPAASDRVAEFERVVTQRTALLRSMRGSGRRPPAMDSWDAQLVECGSRVVADRLSLLGQIAPLGEELHHGVSRGAGELSLAYRLSWGTVLPPGGSLDPEELRGALAEVEVAERERGMCLVGPHRDDMVIHLDERDARTCASQGEARTIAFVLRLSEHGVGSVGASPPGADDVPRSGIDPPMLLLDDVLSELDPGRAEALLEELPKCQTMITTAEPLGRLPIPGNAQLVRVADGHLVVDDQ